MSSSSSGSGSSSSSSSGSRKKNVMEIKEESALINYDTLRPFSTTKSTSSIETSLSI